VHYDQVQQSVADYLCKRLETLLIRKRFTQLGKQDYIHFRTLVICQLGRESRLWHFAASVLIHYERLR
jgi:hypothetical protein